MLTVRPGQAQIGEQWTEQGIRLDDTFERLLALWPRDVSSAARQQRPAGSRSCQISAPNLHYARQHALDQERGRERAEVVGRCLGKLLQEPGELRAAERIPVFRALIGPGDLGPVPPQTKTQWRIEIPTVGRCAGDRLTIPIRVNRSEEHTSELQSPY